MAAGRASLGEKNPKMLIMNPDIIVIIPTVSRYLFLISHLFVCYTKNNVIFNIQVY